MTDAEAEIDTKVDSSAQSGFYNGINAFSRLSRAIIVRPIAGAASIWSRSLDQLTGHNMLKKAGLQAEDRAGNNFYYFMAGLATFAAIIAAPIVALSLGGAGLAFLALPIAVLGPFYVLPLLVNAVYQVGRSKDPKVIARREEAAAETADADAAANLRVAFTNALHLERDGRKFKLDNSVITETVSSDREYDYDFEAGVFGRVGGSATAFKDVSERIETAREIGGEIVTQVEKVAAENSVEVPDHVKLFKERHLGYA